MDKLDIRALFIIILIFAIVLRVGLVLQDRDFWHDEAFQYIYSEKPVSYILDSNDVHPPLFNLFTKLLIDGLGIRSIIWLRTVIVIISMFVIFAFYYAVRDMFSDTSAILATAFFALMPTYVYYSTEFRMYELALLFTVMQIRQFHLLGKKYEDSRILAYVFFSLLMIYTHYLTGLIIFTQVIYLVLRKKWRQTYHISVLVGLYSIPLIIYVARSLPKIQSFWFKDINLVSLGSTFTYLLMAPSSRTMGFAILVYGLLAYLLVRFRQKLDERHLLLGMYVVMPVITMFVISQKIAFYHHRYFLFGGMGLFILLGWGLEQWDKKHKDIWAFPFGLLLGLVIMSQAVQEEINSYELRDSAMFLYNYTANATEPFVTLSESTFSQTPLKVYFHGYEHYLLTNLTEKQRFTAGGSCVEPWEVIKDISELKTNQSVYMFSDKKGYGKIIWTRGGLYVMEIEN